ncbi:MAG: hypothetical protein K0S46_2032 [Moraxellaceae bacterium]|jgi:AraC-like DNA-binding protein|nr:hypothetical protein [Moraxellaceae bacterium]
MSDTLTPANVVLLTLQLLMDDLDMDDLFEHAGVPVQLMLEPDGVITARDILALTASAKELSGDPALGLHLGEEMGVEMLDVVGMTISTAPTLREGLDTLQRFSPLVTTMGHADLIEEGDTAKVVLHFLEELAPITDYCMELAAAAAWHIMRRLVRGEFRLRRLTVSSPRPPWYQEYARVLGEEVEFVFDAPENSIVFDRQLLELPMARHTPRLYQSLLDQAARRLAARPQPETASASVLRLIDEHMGARLLDLATLATYMGMTPRTLQRRLKDENTSFQALYDLRRQQVAQEMLLRDINIETIAATLGYSEPTNFYRAFKAWTGLSPSEYRRRHPGAML